MTELIKRMVHRMGGEGVPLQDEGERFGADGEDAIYRLLRAHFACVLRGVVIPHNNKYLEKDFLILHNGKCAVIEVKNWKGRIGYDTQTGDFFQEKDNGVRKTQKSPVGTTLQFSKHMKRFYGLRENPVGMVIFADPDCRLELPEYLQGVRLVNAQQAVTAIKQAFRQAKEDAQLPEPARILRCTRIYSQDREFCKAILADEEIPCYDEHGRSLRLSTQHLHYIRIEHQPLRLRDKLYVTFTNGSKGACYNHDAVLSFCCLDGSCRRMAIHKMQHILF